MKIKLKTSQFGKQAGDLVEIRPDQVKYMTVHTREFGEITLYSSDFDIIEIEKENKQAASSQVSLRELLGQDVKLIEFK